MEDCARRATSEEQKEAMKVGEGGTRGQALVASDAAEAESVALLKDMAWTKPNTRRDGIPGSSREGLGVYCCAYQPRYTNTCD
jgi:hypothetical protein